MRTILCSVLISAIVGCENSVTSANPLSPAFQLTDTSGQTRTIFSQAEDLDVSFTVTNTSGRKLTFYRADSRPVVIFKVIQNDSIVASSIDGYIFMMVATVGHVEPGESIMGYWRGPTTPAQDPKVMLGPGAYKFQVIFPRFDEAEVKDVSPISFSIIE